MSSVQKAIKYLAIAFGVILAINIISWTIWGILLVGSIVTGTDMFSGNSNEIISHETIDVIESINNLDIELKISKFDIVQGESFQVILHNADKNIEVEQGEGTLRIKDNTSFNLFNKNNQKITICIPNRNRV